MTRAKMYKRWDSVEKLSEREKKLRKVRKGTERDSLAHGKSDEPKPEFIKCKQDKTIEGHHNTVIRLGQNRGPGGSGTCLGGYGGRGDTHAAEISLRAGIGGYQAQSRGSGHLKADPSNADAAWVTVSQKDDEDPDAPEGKTGRAKTRSSLTGTADGVRFSARENIKLRAGSAEISSQGNKINRKACGIDLISGDGSDMQPIPKGKNLQAALDGLVSEIDGLRGIVDAFVTSQMSFNGAIAVHNHISPFFALPTTPSPQCFSAGISTMIDQAIRVKVGCLNQKIGLNLYRLKFLNAIGDGYINSMNNHTN